jgi:hypothetical protein
MFFKISEVSASIAEGIDVPKGLIDNLYKVGRGDSNPHAFQHMILSHARLLIPTLPRWKIT